MTVDKSQFQKYKDLANEFYVTDNSVFVKEYSWPITNCYPNWFKHPFKDESDYFKRGRPFQDPTKNITDIKACEMALREE